MIFRYLILICKTKTPILKTSYIMNEFLVGFIILIAYVLLLFIIKKLGWGKKKTCKNCNNCCSYCQSSLKRAKRKLADHFLNQITLRIFDYKRCICSNCGWEGLRWEENYNTGKN